MLLKNIAVSALALTSLVACASGGDKTDKKAAGAAALNGYDTVAYFTLGKAAKGSDAHTTTYKGHTWKFANADHLAKFKSNPDKYAPQYGGFCAWGLGAKGKLFPSDPNVFLIRDGKLYLNYNADISKKWKKDLKGFIKSADKNWPKTAQPVAVKMNEK